VSAILGTVWARGPRLRHIRLDEPHVNQSLTRSDAVERVTRIELGMTSLEGICAPA
jgi:hypothetical protein